MCGEALFYFFPNPMRCSFLFQMIRECIKPVTHQEHELYAALLAPLKIRFYDVSLLNTEESFVKDPCAGSSVTG